MGEGGGMKTARIRRVMPYASVGSKPKIKLNPSTALKM